MEDLSVSSTGMPVLDSLLGGGYLSNSIIVISYQIGIKIFEFFHQILLNNLDDKTYLIVVTFHFSVQEDINWLKASMPESELFRKVMKIISSKNASFIDCFNVPDSEEVSQKGNIYYVSNPFNVENLLSVMAQVREKVPVDKRALWFFYDLTDMSVGVPEDELVKFCRRVFRYHKQQGDKAIYTLNEKAHPDTFFAKVYQLSDVFIKLIAEETLWGVENGVQVIKSVFPFQSKRVFYDVNEKREINFTTNKLESKPQTQKDVFSTTGLPEGERDEGIYSKLFRTGIPRFDFLIGGGFLPSSMILFSYQYGVRILEPIHHIFRNQFGEKTHLILINYHYSPLEYETRTKILGQKIEIHKAPIKSFSYGNTSIIDCFNISSEKNTEENKIYLLSNPFDADKLLSIMTRARDDVSENKSVFWLFNSLTDMNIGVPEEDLLKFCRRAFRYHKSKGDLALYLLNEQAHSEIFLAKLYQLSDVFIKFIAEDIPRGIDTSIQVLKGPLNFNSIKTKYLLDENGCIKFVDD